MAKILAIESSCDETAVAVCEGTAVLSSVIASQVEEHKLYGGVVPEIASRRHTEAISALCEQALEEASCGLSDISAVAVTYAPGLIGALLVGVNFAKGLALSANLPLVPVHHLRSHIAANYITNPQLKPPFLCLLVSGGNSHIVMVENYTKFTVLGRTRDDAAGECFDKSARILGLPYPGGVHLDKLANEGDPSAFKLPTPVLSGNDLDMSFSGLKTAVINTVHTAEQRGETVNRADMAASLRRKVCDILLDKTFAAAQRTGAKTIAMAGGVSANSELRQRFETECAKRNIAFFRPELKYCGDNAAMVGVQAHYELKAGHIADSSLNAFATLPIETEFTKN